MMDTSTWKEFRVGDLFQCINGSMHIVDDEPTERSIDYYTTTEINNGYGGTVSDYKDSDIIKVPSLTVGSRGNDAITYFHNPPYIANQNLTVCIPLSPISELAMQFVATVIRQEKYKFSYGRIMSKEVVKNTIISLPATPSGDPDWAYMEEFMGGLHSEPLTTSVKSSHIPLETEKWGEFKVGELFKIELAKGDIKLDNISIGEVPLVSSGETNNGIVGYIDQGGDGKSEIFDGNKITVDMFGNAYYQDEPFYAVSHGRVNILTPMFELKPNIGLFIASIIKADQYKYSYGRAVYSRVVENMIIRLPQTSDGKPDWEWMENYMKSLPYSDRVV